jgi:hypothetical protein
MSPATRCPQTRSEPLIGTNHHGKAGLPDGHAGGNSRLIQQLDIETDDQAPTARQIDTRRRGNAGIAGSEKRVGPVARYRNQQIDGSGITTISISA